LWWVFAYPLAGWIGSNAPNHNFLYSSLTGLALLFMVYVVLQPRQLTNTDTGLWHEHDHLHHEDHYHRHEPSVSHNSHSHLHFHATTSTEINH
jgi:MFS transporter, NRE family, putaive nickel resistance protein